MTDKEYARVLQEAARRRAIIEAAIAHRRPMPGEATGAGERHNTELYAYACGYRD
jgi:hypothetical protein